MNKKKILLGIFAVWAVISLAVFVITKNEYLMKKFTVMDIPYGNLFDNCKVDIFKIPLEPTLNSDHLLNRTHINSCDLIILGDSQMRICPGHYLFPVEISNNLNISVYYLRIEHIPFGEFNESGISKISQERIFLMETAESELIRRFYEMPDLHPRVVQSGSEAKSTLINLGNSWIAHTRSRWFVDTEKNYSFFIKNNIFFKPLVEFYYSFLFHKFGYISSLTPVYSLNPPFLFDKKLVDSSPSSFYFHHSDRLIQRIADNIKTVSDSLKTIYNLKMVFMPVPSNFTLYHKLVTDDQYDNYLPRLYQALAERGVPTIDLYEPFIESSKFVVNQTDTHWNSLGVSIALQKTLMKLSEIMNHNQASIPVKNSSKS